MLIKAAVYLVVVPVAFVLALIVLYRGSDICNPVEAAGH